MHLGVRKPVVDANRSGCSYEIPDMTWFSKRNKRAVILKSGAIVYLDYSQAGWYHGKSSLLHNCSRDFFYTKGEKMMHTCGGNPRC